jgi:serine/threonine protein phosphatase PrpC
MALYYIASLLGKRETNEDQEVVIDNISGEEKDKLAITYLAVFDGHAGPNVSKYLGENLHKYFFDSEYPLKKKRINDIYDIVQKKLENQHGNFSKFSGSTALVAIMYDIDSSRYLHVMNTGDCRIVMCRNNIACPLTKDHKPNKPEEAYRLKKMGGEVVFDGVDYRIKNLSVSRSFGDLDTAPYVIHRPDIFKYKVELNKPNGDKFLIMGCDGLWDVVENQEAIDFVLNNCYDSPINGKRINKNINIAHKLATYAIESKGSTDNVSVIVYFFSQ